MLKNAISSVISAGFVTAAASVALAQPAPIHEHVLPERNDVPEVRAQSWRAEGSWLVAPPDRPGGEGTRVAGYLEVDDEGSALRIEARGLAADASGDWIVLEETFRGDGVRVVVADLDEAWPAAELRVMADDEERIDALHWELLEPLYPHAGAEARALAEQASLLSTTLDPEFAAIGVVSRATWGARPTRCSTREDNWYRMAIHHTVGGQTSGGTVVGSVRGLQAYSQDGGGWCDIPYQFLVGYDGSLYEGRPLQFFSGATGGANTGNMAISFLGCYHPNGCPASIGSHEVTEEMMRGALTLIQTAARLHNIPIDSQSIRGHRDYGNPTACPGDFVHARLDELRRSEPPPAAYAAEVVERSVDPESTLDLVAGETLEVWAEFQNVGTSAWEPGVTFLAPTAPRDAASPLFHSSWPSSNRAATVEGRVEPGEIGRFAFQIYAENPGDLEVPFGLVQEGDSWFSDAPLGGGPGDDALTVVVRVSATGGDEGGAGGAPIIDDHGDVTLAGGCQASRGASSAAAAMALIALFALGPSRRRKREG